MALIMTMHNIVNKHINLHIARQFCLPEKLRKLSISDGIIVKEFKETRYSELSMKIFFLANFIFAIFHYYVHISFRFSTYIYKNLVVYVKNMTLLITCVNVVSFVLVKLAEIRQVYRLSYGNYPPVKAVMLDTVD